MAISYQDLYVGSPSGDWYLRLYYDSITQSIEKNQSIINLRLTLRGSNPYGWVEFDRRDAWIGGNYFAIAYHHNPPEHDLGSATYIINHDEQGVAGFSVGFGISTSYMLNGSGTFQLSLPTIPRTSAMGTVNFSNFWSGFNVTYIKYYSGFNCKLRVYYPGASVIQTFDSYASGSSIVFSSAIQDAIIKKLISSKTAVLGFVIETWNGATKIGESVEKTISISLPTVNQISSMTNFNIDDGFVIGLSRSYPSYTSKLDVIALGKTVYSAIISDNQKVAFNASQLSVIYDLMKSVNSTAITIQVTSIYANLSVGSVVKTVTGAITNAVPSLPQFSWQSINNLTLHNSETIVKGYSDVKVNIQQATAYKGATISYYQVTIGTKTAKVTSLEAILSGCDGSNIIVHAVDSRGNTAIKQLECNHFIDYNPLILNNLYYARGTGGIGSEVTISFSGTAWSDNFGLTNNALTAQYFYKEAGASTWITGTTPITVTCASKFTHSVSVKGDLGAGGFDSNKNFDFKVIVSDKLSNSSKENIITKGIPQLSFGKGGVGFGGFYDESLTDMNGRPFPVQIYSSYFGMMIPCGVNVVDDEAFFLKNGSSTNLKKLKEE